MKPCCRGPGRRCAKCSPAHWQSCQSCGGLHCPAQAAFAAGCTAPGQSVWPRYSAMPQLCVFGAHLGAHKTLHSVRAVDSAPFCCSFDSELVDKVQAHLLREFRPLAHMPAESEAGLNFQVASLKKELRTNKVGTRTLRVTLIPVKQVSCSIEATSRKENNNVLVPLSIMPLHALLFAVAGAQRVGCAWHACRCSGCGAGGALAKPRLPRRCLITCSLRLQTPHASWGMFAARVAMNL